VPAVETERGAERGGGTVGEVVRLGLKLGVTAFGGPAAHVAMLRQDVVERRGWIGEKHFLDLLGITNLIPGPNSTEMVIHVGYERAGWRGLIGAGLAFILPAASITLGFAWLYERYGTEPAGRNLLYGIEPVIIAVVAQAIWSLGRTAVRTVPAMLLAASVVTLYLLGFNELALLAGSAAIAVLARLGTRLTASDRAVGPSALLAPASLGKAGVTLLGLAAAADQAVAYSHLRLFLTFLKIGSVLYGSGYVLLAFLRNDFVERYGWLTEQQLIDAVAVGQFTPGPVFTAATFVGYLAGGFPGAILATVAIFLPAFVFVAVANPLLPRLRRSPWIAAALDGVNLGALGLMAAVLWELGRAAIVDLPTAALALVAAGLLIRYKVNSAWLVLGGAAAGLVLGPLR
jgi:chromate transporter